MLSTTSMPLPENAFLRRFHDMEGGYADCYRVVVPNNISLSAYLNAFFNTPVFRVERKLLGWFASKPTKTADVTALIRGQSETFAIWAVDERDENQLLMAVSDNITFSWWMVEPSDNETILYFGSALKPIVDAKTGKASMSKFAKALLAFHKLYSRVLLGLAARKFK